MIADWLIQRALDWRTYSVIALLSSIGVIAYKIDQHGYNRGVSHNQAVIDGLNKTILDGREIYAQSLKDSSRQTLVWQAKTDKANEDANNAKQKLETITANNARLVASLRNTTNKAIERIKLPDTTKDSADQYAITESVILNDCVSKYSELGKIADSHVIDEQKLIDSYPQTKE